MTSSGPGDDVTLDAVVARVRELPTRFRSLYVETERHTDDRWGRIASSRALGTLVHRPDPSTQPEQRTSMTSRSWMQFGEDSWRHKFPIMGVQPARWRNEARFQWADGRTEEIVTGRDGDVDWDGVDDDAEFWIGQGGSVRDWWVLNRLWVDAPLELERLATTSEVLGRECVHIGIRSQPGRFRMWAPGPFVGGEHVLSIDLATGLTLAIRSSNDGVPYQSHDVVALELDGEIDSALTQRPRGARPREDPPRYADEAALAEIVDGFMLVMPTLLPEGYAFQLAYPETLPDQSMRATITYSLDGRQLLRFHQSAASAGPLPDVDGWTRIERDDRAVLISDATQAEGTRHAVTAFDGTHVFIVGALSAGELLDVAFSLEPVAG